VIPVIMDAFRRSPRRFALMLLDMGFVNPLLLHQVAIAVLHPSLASVALIPMLAFLGHLAINIRMMAALAVGSQRVISDCLAKGVSGTTLRVSDVLAQGGYQDAAGIYADLERWLLQFNGLTRRTLDEMICVHYAPGSGIFKAYSQSQFYCSHLFISSLPTPGSPFQRFFFLHEIGHSLTYIFTRPISTVAAVPAQVCFAGWLIYSLPWTAAVAGPALAFLVTLAAWHERARWNAQAHRGLSEIMADTLAVRYLGDSDLKRLSSSPILSGLRDEALTHLQNVTRKGALREHVNMALKGKGDEATDQAMAAFAITPPRFLEGLAVASVLLLAAHAVPSTGGDLWVAAVSLVVALAVFAVIVVFYQASRGALTAALDEKFPASKADDAAHGSVATI